MKKIQQDDELYEKMHQCENFVWLICVCGITIPLIASIFVLKNTTHLLSIVSVLTAIAPTICAFSALVNYHKAYRAKLDGKQTIQDKTEKRANYLLYLGGVLSIIFVTVYVVLSGGIKDNLMAFYFVFIPSTTAVAFNTRLGLVIVSLTSAICLGVLYYFCYEYGYFYECGSFYKLNSVEEPDKGYYFGFMIFQIGLIIALEYFTNNLRDNISKKKNHENE